MTKQISAKTQMTKKMEAFITGRTRNCDIVTPNGEQVFYVAPNRFGPGYIYWFVGDVKWSADLKRNDPEHVARVKEERMTEEQQLSFHRHVLKSLQDRRKAGFYTMKWAELQEINAAIDVSVNWLLDHKVAV